MGRPLAGCEYAIDAGQLVVRGRILCAGLWSDEKPLREFATGDCCCEEKGVLTVTGRSAESAVVKVLGRRVGAIRSGVCSRPVRGWCRRGCARWRILTWACCAARVLM